MKRTPGRPPADEVANDAAKQVLDAKKIITEDSTAKILEKANALLEQTTKSSLLSAAVNNAKKAELMSKRDLEDLRQEDQESAKPKRSFGKLGEVSVEDIRSMAETLPEDQREGFIKQALGMQASAGNPMMSAWFTSKAQQQPVVKPATDSLGLPAQPMSLAEMMQSMMSMMMMQNQLQQQKADQWREQQEFEANQHRMRMDELREIMGGKKSESENNPEINALKMQMEFYKDIITQNQNLIKELGSASKTDGMDELRKEILSLTQNNLEAQKTALDQKVSDLENRLADARQFNLNIHEMVKKANEAGANIHVGDTTDVQLANEHEYRMEQLRLQAEREERDYNMTQSQLSAQAESAKAQQDAIKMIVTEVGGAIVQSKLGPRKSLEQSSPGVKSLVGAM
jgi:hypothetical protein